MLIAGVEVPDSAVEAAFKASGKRIVEESDYTKKAEAGNDLAKLRKVLGEGRDVGEIESIIKAHEANEKKNKTESELLKSELQRLQAELTAKASEVQKRDFEIKKRDVDNYFKEAQEKTGIKVIEPILAEFKNEFYNMSAEDEAKFTPETLKERVTQTLAKAQELQKGELARLGINGSYPANSPSIANGVFNNTPSLTRPVANENDLFAIMRETSATPSGAPLLKPNNK